MSMHIASILCPQLMMTWLSPLHDVMCIINNQCCTAMHGSYPSCGLSLMSHADVSFGFLGFVVLSFGFCEFCVCFGFCFQVSMFLHFVFWVLSFVFLSFVVLSS